MPNVHADPLAGASARMAGQMVSNVAADLGDLAGAAQTHQNRIDDFERRKAIYDLDSAVDDAARESLGNLQPGAAGYTDGMLKVFDERAKKAVAALPQSVRGEAEMNVTALRDRYRKVFASTEDKERSRYFGERIQEFNDKLLKTVRANPGAYEAAKKQGLDNIAQSGLSPVEKEAASDLWNHSVALAWAQTLPADERKRLFSTTGRQGYYDALKQAESSGRSDAKNDGTTATGWYQITEGTWKTLREKHPELGLKPDGRLDPAQQERAIRALTKDNADILAENGIADTNANLYAAHFLGAGRAVDVLQADPQTPLSKLVPAEYIAKNPHLKGMTSGDFRAWAAAFIAKGAKGAPAAYRDRMEHLSYDDEMKLGDQADRDILKIGTEHANAFNLAITRTHRPSIR